MANEFRSLIEMLRELKALALKKASGFFFVVTEDNHSCTIRLRSGQIEDVVFSRHRSDAAVQLLSQVSIGRARFQADPTGAAGPARISLSEASLQWLLGGFENGPATQSGPPARAEATAEPDRQREIVEKIALNYFGPIAGLLCDEAFSAWTDLDRVLGRLASNLPVRDESEQFLAEAKAALARLR